VRQGRGAEAAAAGRAGKREKRSADDLLPCADDLLSLMVLLLTRASVHYLSANATFMDHFLSLQTPFQHKGELGCELPPRFSAPPHSLTTSPWLLAHQPPYEVGDTFGLGNELRGRTFRWQ
jgi:hypothetical protein